MAKGMKVKMTYDHKLGYFQPQFEATRGSNKTSSHSGAKSSRSGSLKEGFATDHSKGGRRVGRMSGSAK